jgi:hypothetical protein
MPPNKEQLKEWRQLNKMEEIGDEIRKIMIEQTVHLTELEDTGEWKQSDDDSFELFLEHEHSLTLDDFRWLQRAVFDHLDEVRKSGLGNVITRLKKLS